MIRALLLGLFLLATGCQLLLPVESQPSKIHTVDRERLPVGVPTVTLSESPDHALWTVVARQDYRRITESITTRAASVRRYRWWPLAPLSGLLQCPVGLLSAPFTDRAGIRALRQVGCMRLIGMEPLQHTAIRTHYDERVQEERIETSPAPGLSVTFVPENHPEETVWLTTDGQGTAVVTHQAIQAIGTHAVSGTLEVRDGKRSLLARHITVSPSPGTTATDVPTLRLEPSEPLIVEVQPFTTPSGDVLPTVHTQLIAALTQAGIAVTADRNDYQLLIEEIRLQHQRASDAASVRLGRLLNPTVRIEGVAEETEGRYRITTRIYRVRTGEYQSVVLLGSPKTVALEILSLLTTKH